MDKKLLSDFTARSARINELFKHDLFFICGAPKSGTTWFQRLLDSHPEIVCSGEGHFTEGLLAPFGNLIQQYNKRQVIAAQRVYEGNPYYHGLKAQDIEFLARTMIGLIMSQRRIPEGTICVGDKTPRYTLKMKMLSRVFPEARFINVIRDGRDVITSTCHHTYRAGHPSVIDKTRPEYFKATQEIANVWINNVNSAEQFGRDNPGKYHMVKYEDMLEYPEKTLASLLAFLNVSTDESVISECISKNEFKKLSGGRERGEEDKNSYFRVGTSGGWNEFLTPSALKNVYAIAGQTLCDLGYLDKESLSVSTQNPEAKTRQKRQRQSG